MVDALQHFRQAYEYLSELGERGYAIDPEESPTASSVLVHRNCLSAMEEAVAGGLRAAGTTPPDGLAAKTEALREEYDALGDLDAVLSRWADFDPADADPVQNVVVMWAAETVIEGVLGLIDDRIEEALVRVDRGVAALDVGKYAIAKARFREALGILQRTPRDAKVSMLNYLGISAETLGDDTMARERCDACVELACEAVQDEPAAMARKNLGMLGSDGADAAVTD